MTANDYNEIFTPLPSQQKIKNNIYFEWLCIFPWIFLIINAIATYNLFNNNLSFFQSITNYIFSLICCGLIVLNIIFVLKDMNELKKVNIIVKKSLILHSIFTMIFNACTIDSYFVARNKVYRHANGRFHTIIPTISVGICWAYDLYRYFTARLILTGVPYY